MSATRTKGAATDSPLARARRRHLERQKHSHHDIDMPGWDGDLVLRIGLPDDDGAMATVRTLIALANTETKADADTMADALASAVIGLYSREGGGLEPLEVDGLVLKFDERYGPAMEIEECTTPRQAVFAAFTQGEPPQLNVAAMIVVVSAAGAWLQGVTGVEEKDVSGR